MYRSHNPSYIRFLRTSAERDADPDSVAVGANAEGKKNRHKYKYRHIPIEKGNTVMSSGFVYFKYDFPSCAVILICWFSLILCSHRFVLFYMKGLCALWRNST